MNIKKVFHSVKSERKPDIALVLGGGGARGYAHIGAIEVLLEHGYHISSVCGTSMGALVGGLYAAGKLDELKKIVLGLKKKEVFSLVDISPGKDHIATAEKLTKVMASMTNDANIEQLPIDFCCVASDIVSGKEYIFNQGPLSYAIRASISIPGIFSPVKDGKHVFVDGGVNNTLPLNRIKRNNDDLLVAIDASGPDDPELPVLKGKQSGSLINMALRVSQIVVQCNTALSLKLTPPDLYIDVPTNSFGLLDFERGAEIIQYGRDEMEKALKDFEARKPKSLLDRLLSYCRFK